MKFACSICLLVLLLVSGMDAALRCSPCSEEYLMLFQDRTNTDYAILANSIADSMHATTVCFFARDYPDESSSTTEASQCVYSYAITGSNNEFFFCLAPTIRVLINGNRREVGFGVQDDDWHHYCFTWSSLNGDYAFYTDGVSVSSGAGFVQDSHISSGGTSVIGQDQDSVGGGFVAAQAYVGDLTQVNVWNTVLSESDIQAQASTCYIGKGTQVIQWSQFKDNVHGGVVLVRP